MKDDNKNNFWKSMFVSFECERSPDQTITTFECGPHCLLSKYEIDSIHNSVTILTINNPGCHEDMTDVGRGVCNKGCYE